MDWTRPQPGEDAAAAGRRRGRVKDLMRKAMAYLEVRLAYLARMKEEGMSMEVSRRPAFRLEVMAVRDHCQGWWTLLLTLFKQAEGEKQFGEEMMGRLQQAKASGMGVSAGPLTQEPPAPADGPSPCASGPEVAAGKPLEDPGPAAPDQVLASPAPGHASQEEGSAEFQKCVAQEGGKVAVEAKNRVDPDRTTGTTRIPRGRVSRLESGAEGRAREISARRAGLRSSQGSEKMTCGSATGLKEGTGRKGAGGGAPGKMSGGAPGVGGRGAARGRGQSVAGAPGKGAAGTSGATASGKCGRGDGAAATGEGAGNSKMGGAGGQGVVGGNQERLVCPKKAL